MKVDFFALFAAVKGTLTTALPPPPVAVRASEEYIPTLSVPAIQDVATPLNVVLVAAPVSSPDTLIFSEILSFFKLLFVLSVVHESGISISTTRAPAKFFIVSDILLSIC
ncbi:hypothetical protein SDC9_205222 [bioreactor metagenome]|uniref:Uncharacterized protein n=1 Tax=bioreactor metagenome TaxID=1076179 RepID=A0A645J1H0_9ZZZZ